MKIITREQMKQLEALTTNEFYLPTLLLMENAGRSSAQAAIKFLRDLGHDLHGSKVTIICGSGNNGGDGAVAARHLHNLGIEVEVILTQDSHGFFWDINGEKIKKEKKESAEKILGDVGVNLKILKAFEIPVKRLRADDSFVHYFQNTNLIVDALMGTGLDTMTTTSIRSPIREFIIAINELEIPVLSLDLPSGLDANTGALAGICIEADRTVTFGLPKKGCYENMGPTVCGEITAVDICIPRKLMRQAKDAREDEEE